MHRAEEEKLEPVRTSTDDPRIRLLNRLYARKRRELQERKSLREGAEPEGQPVRRRALRLCQRALDSLLAYAKLMEA